MYIETQDGFRYNDTEGSASNYNFTVHISPDNYSKLLLIAHKKGILTFDISSVLEYVIKNFPY